LSFLPTRSEMTPKRKTAIAFFASSSIGASFFSKEVPESDDEIAARTR
jgi:hypothetical protein